MNVRNGAPFLREALDSVFKQTFQDWEIVVWDDCSTDDSAAIVREYPDPRIRYVLSPEDTTLGPARNMAIREARGEWIAFLDQDDIWLPGKLSKQIGIADLDNDGRLGMVYGRTVEFFPDGHHRDFDHHHEFENLPEGDLFQLLFRLSCFISISSAMLRRSVLEEIGEVPSTFALISDYYLFLAIARHYEIRAVQEVICRYRRHNDSLSSTCRIQMYQEALLLPGLWPDALPPAMVSKIRTGYETEIALLEIIQKVSAARGLKRLLSRGSFSHLFRRVGAFVARRARNHWPFRRFTRAAAISEMPGTAAAVLAEQPLLLSIIVVNWNVRDLLRDCIQSIYGATRLPAGAWEVIIVDNNSADNSVEMVRREFPEVRIIANDENTGFARANNQAFRVCGGQFVLLLNPDVVVLDFAIDRALEMMRSQPRIGVLGCSLLNSDGTEQEWTAGALPGLSNVLCHYLFLYQVLPSFILPRPFFPLRQPQKDVDAGWISGAFMLLRRDALGNEIFDERFFMYGEDVLLCQSLARAGWRVFYTPRIRIIHHGGCSTNTQTQDVQMARFLNLRQVFGLINGRIALWFFDVGISFAFMIRSMVFTAASCIRPGRGYNTLAAKNRQYLAQAIRTFGSR